MNFLPRPEGPSADDLKLSRRAAVGSMFFTGYAAYAFSADAQPVTTPDAGLTIEEVLIPNGEAKPLPAYVARPARRGRFPTIIVVNEIFGIHAWIKDICKRWAHEGYVAIAPAFFHRAGDPSQLTDYAQIRPIVAATPHAQVMKDVDTTLAWLKKQKFSSGKKSGITGFCWGGTVVWMAAARPGIAAGAAYYGRVVLPPTPPGQPAQGEPNRPYPVDIARDLKAPVIGFYGGKDRGIPLETVEQMRAALKAAGKTDSEIIVYPDADHGFLADYRPSFHPEAAKDAWARNKAHFKKYLK